MRPGDSSWLEAEQVRLLTFGTSAAPGSWLDDRGLADPTRPRQTWLAARTLYVRSLGVLLEHPGSELLAAGALAALDDEFRDHEHGGWLPVEKSCYQHAFVLLAATTAHRAEVPGSERLLADAEAVFEERFWDGRSGMCVDEWERDWSNPSAYRGLNGTMHAVEAMLAVGGVWVDRAARICDRVVGIGRDFGWRLPEHYDEQWVPHPDFNREQPDDPFKPYGATVGHAFEWARLLLHLDSVTGQDHTAAAAALYERAATDGWAVDGAEGFVYTTDWDGRPVVHDRMHWVLAEAVAAAAVLHAATGEERYERDARTWWQYADRYLLDRDHGSWHHQLDRHQQPLRTVWPGKPDLYHALQATLFARYPVRGSLAEAIVDSAQTLPTTPAS
ncbi:MAG: AGE family epimerase/isomerase [Propionibacteriales bacterium]|nr:AGE family epimerase/isomerase [Propionibacteriales bacterium]